MIVLTAGLAGAALGARRAKLRGGGRADMAQYAAAHAIAFALLGLFVTIAVDTLF